MSYLGHSNRLGVGDEIDRAVLLHEAGDVTGFMAVEAELHTRAWMQIAAKDPNKTMKKNHKQRKRKARGSVSDVRHIEAFKQRPSP